MMGLQSQLCNGTSDARNREGGWQGTPSSAMLLEGDLLLFWRYTARGTLLESQETRKLSQIIMAASIQGVQGNQGTLQHSKCKATPCSPMFTYLNGGTVGFSKLAPNRQKKQKNTTAVSKAAWTCRKILFYRQNPSKAQYMV